MTTPTSTGMNRTGIQMAPLQSSRMLEISNDSQTRPGDELSPFAQVRRQYASESAPVGTVPPPGSMKGMATTAMEMLKGNKPTVFIDKLGERLAFERTGVRLYEAVLTKFDALGSWDGGPSRAQLAQIRDEELEHFEMLKQTIDKLGADPTAMTPSADMVANEASGVLKVVSDSRTTLAQSLHAMLVIERADIEGWGLLIDLAGNIGQNELAQRFRDAEATEERHGQLVRSWLASSVLADVHREMSGNQPS
jgi:ferritin-like metal-binding protein YciE